MKNNGSIEFETLHSNKHRIYLLCGIVCVVVLMVTLIITTSKAKYRTTQSIPFIQGTINFSPYDYKTVAMYIDGEPVDTLPDGKYELTEESYCTNEDNEKDESITLSYDSATQGLLIAPMNKKGTKCYLYFVERLCPEGATACNTIVAASKPQGQTTDWTGETTYYYTGNPNNWVQFAGFWWRIIRINGDGSIRMIYQGTSANTTGTGTQIGTSAFNSSNNYKRYVGLVYNTSSQHGYGTNSTIMTTLNNWYNNNIENDDKNLHYEQYIDTGAGFCSDRNMASGYNWSSSTVYYAAYDRYNGPASLQCHDDDILSQDNGKLPNPIGLVTSDEAVLTGITWSSANTGSYLYTGQNYWTMSPYNYDGYGAHVFIVSSDGNIYWGSVYDAWGVRPVINIRADVSLTGTGTVDDPFKIA